MRINQPVITPLGEGVYQGSFNQPHSGDTVEPVALVRLRVNDQTAPHLRDSNCLTPKASGSGLWTFKEGELQ